MGHHRGCASKASANIGTIFHSAKFSGKKQPENAHFNKKSGVTETLRPLFLINSHLEHSVPLAFKQVVSLADFM